ncbi:MAG: DUF1761 domain-containing protein [Patescibacteria group bacterium]
MDWSMALSDLNYWAVAVATLASFPIGMAWYSMAMFGKTWMKEAGLSKKDVENKDEMMKAMVHSAVAAFISTVTLGALILATGTNEAIDGALFGALVGFGIAMTTQARHDAFSQKSITLTRINGAFDIVTLAVVGAILAAWM